MTDPFPDATDADAPAAPCDSLDAFRVRHGDIEVIWPTWRLRLFRWACVIVAAAILLGFTQSAEITLALRFVEVAIGVVLLLGFVWLRGATPAGGGVAVDADGIRLLPDGPRIPPGDVAALAVAGTRRMPSLVARTLSERDLAIPLRARLSGHDVRIALTREFAGAAPFEGRAGNGTWRVDVPKPVQHREGDPR